jgi:hypothetical protein
MVSSDGHGYVADNNGDKKLYRRQGDFNNYRDLTMVHKESCTSYKKLIAEFYDEEFFTQRTKYRKLFWDVWYKVDATTIQIPLHEKLKLDLGMSQPDYNEKQLEELGYKL